MISVEKAKAELGAGGWASGGTWLGSGRPSRTYRRQDKDEKDDDVCTQIS